MANQFVIFYAYDFPEIFQVLIIIHSVMELISFYQNMFHMGFWVFLSEKSENSY